MMVSVEHLVFSGETCSFPGSLFPLSAPPESFSQGDLRPQFQLAARNSGNRLCLKHPFSGVTGCKVKFRMQHGIQAVSKKALRLTGLHPWGVAGDTVVFKLGQLPYISLDSSPLFWSDVFSPVNYLQMSSCIDHDYQPYCIIFFHFYIPKGILPPPIPKAWPLPLHSNIKFLQEERRLLSASLQPSQHPSTYSK